MFARSEEREALLISVRPPKSPYPRSDSPANGLWCHPPGVQWLMHPGCQLLHLCKAGELREEVNGLNFPQIETSKCERRPAWGRVRAQLKVLHTCNIVNVLFLMSCLPVKAIHKCSPVERQCSCWFDEDTGKKARMWLYTCTAPSTWALLPIKAGVEGSGREGDKRMMRILWVEDKVFLRYACRHAVMSSAGSPHSRVSRPRKLQLVNHKLFFFSFLCSNLLYVSEGRYLGANNPTVDSVINSAFVNSPILLNVWKMIRI